MATDLSRFDTVYEFKDGLAKVELDGKQGHINSSGEIVIPLKYDWVSDFCDGHAYFEIYSEDKWGQVDKNGKESVYKLDLDE